MQNIIRVNVIVKTLTPLFTKLLTPGLTWELCNPLDDWLESICLANHHLADYIIRGLI